jgi:hypothetical protein
MPHRLYLKHHWRGAEGLYQTVLQGKQDDLIDIPSLMYIHILQSIVHMYY